MRLLQRPPEGNHRHVAAAPPIPQAAGPGDRLAVVTRMDVRFDACPSWGCGQATSMSCEAAARVTDDVVGSLATSRQAFGTDVVILTLHTFCGVPARCRKHETAA